MIKGNEETKIMNEVSVTLSNKNYLIYRNNVGKGQMISGRWVQFGLCVGSSDLIGIKSIIITTEDVGKKLGLFCAFEIKTKNGELSKEQKNFLNIIKAHGGLTNVLRSNSEAEKLPNAEFVPVTSKRTNGRQGVGNIQPKKTR